MDDDGNAEDGTAEDGAGKRWEPRPDLVPPGILQPPTQAVPYVPEPDPAQTVAPEPPATTAVPPVPGALPTSGPPTPPQGQPPVPGPPFDAFDPPSASVPATPDRPDKRRQLIIAASALGVVALLVIGFLVFRAASGDDDDTATSTSSTSTSTSSTTSTTEGPLSGRIDLGQGITAIVPEGSLPAGATLEADPSQLPGEAAGAMVAVSPFVKIRVVDGEQTGPIDLEFPVDPPAAATPDSGDPVLVALHQTDALEPVAGTYDIGAGRFTVTADSVDGWGVAGWIWDQVTDALDDAVSARTDGLADAGDPSCNPDGTDLVEATTGEGAPAWCAELADDGSRTLRLVNRLDHLVTVVWGDGTNAAPDGGGQLSDPLERWVDDADGTGSLALAPGEAAHVSIPADVQGTADVSYDGVAHAATSLLTAADVVAATTDLASFVGASTDAATVLGAVDVAACLDGAWKEGSVEPALLAAIVAACFSEPTLSKALDPKVATLVTPLLASGPVAAHLTDAWGSGVTAMAADADSTFSVATAAGPWPVDDQEAGFAYTSWLLLDGFTADWSSCSGGLCIAGDGDQVRVDDVSGFEPQNLGTTSQDTVDARGALLALGVTEDEATALLTPGPA